MTDATYRPDDWPNLPPPERSPYREALAVHDHERRIAALEKRLADLAEAVTLLAENDEDVAASVVRNERLRTTIQDRADEARSYAEAPEDGAERDRA